MIFFIVFIALFGIYRTAVDGAPVERKAGKIYIVDRKGERWDVTQAKSIGFDPQKCQYGLGRNAIVPLDESALKDATTALSSNQRIIGVKDGDHSHAYSVRKLRLHEIANTRLGSKSIAAAY